MILPHFQGRMDSDSKKEITEEFYCRILADESTATSNVEYLEFYRYLNGPIG